MGWLFRNDVTHPDFDVVTPAERIQETVDGIASMSSEIQIDVTSCLAVARFVRMKLRRTSQVETQLPLGPRIHRSGSPDHTRFMVEDIRFDGDCLNDALNTAGIQLGLPQRQLTWDAEFPTDEYPADRIALGDVQRMLIGWLNVLETAIRERRELPSGWEPDGNLLWPKSPILNIEHLRAWLEKWLESFEITRSKTSGLLLRPVSKLTLRPENYLEEIRRELRNSRRAMEEWGVPLPAGFDEDPADIHKAERQLKLLIDELSKPAGEMPPEVTGEPPKPVEPLAETLGKDKPAVEAEFIFRPDGDGYFIKGFGESGNFITRGAKGWRDLYRLVQTPGVKVRMTELEAGESVNRAAGDQRSIQPVLDGLGFQNVTQELRRLQADIESIDPTSPASGMEREELERDRDGLTSELNKVRGMGGKVRDLNASDLNRMKSNISGRIKTVCKQIEKRYPLLSQYFRDTTGAVDAAFYSYTPGVPNMGWDTESKTVGHDPTK